MKKKVTVTGTLTFEEQHFDDFSDESLEQLAIEIATDDPDLLDTEVKKNPPCPECGYSGLFDATMRGDKCPECGTIDR